MALAKSNFQLPSFSVAAQPLTTLRFPALTGKTNWDGLNRYSAGSSIAVLRFPTLLYLGALSTGAQASSTTSVDQLTNSQIVTTDVTQLAQIWN